MFFIFRSTLKEGDKILFANMPKLKRLPNTKAQDKYLGPHTVAKVTDSHVVISNTNFGTKKDKKIPLHIVRPYFERSLLKTEKTKRKRKAESIGPEHKKLRPNSSQVYIMNSLEFICT